MRSPKLCFRIAALLVLIAAESALTSRAQTAGPSHVYENLGTVLPRTGIPSTAIWRQGNLLYGEAVDPDTDKGPFVVYDLNKRKVLYSGNEDIHTGFRCIMVDNEGNAYFSVNTTGLGKYDPRTNSVTVLNVTLSASLRASTRQASDGWIYGATNRPDNKLFRFHPTDNQIEYLGSVWDYTTTMVLDPTERYVYFVPGAHGNGWSMGAPLVQFDVQIRKHKVIAFLNNLYESKYNYRLGGTYAIDLDPDGKRLFINMNAVNLARKPGSRSGFDDPAVLVVQLPATETGAVSPAPLRFKNVAAETGLESMLGNAYIHTSSWGDVDGDGWLDLFAGTFVQGSAQVPNRLLLYRNGAFQDSGQTAVAINGRASGSVFADFDNDTDLDLFVSNNRIEGMSGVSGERSRIFRNDRDAFTDVTDGSGIDAQAGNGRQVGVLDYNNDGLLDLFVVADALRGNGPSVLLRNKGNFIFENATAAAGLPSNIHGLGLAIADVTGDGRPDVFVAGGPTGSEAYRNYLFAANADGTYRQVNTPVFDWAPFVNGGEDWVSGAAFGDLNRDGRLDLLVGHHFGSSAEKGIGASLRVYMNRGLNGSGDPIFDDITSKLGLPKIVSKAPHVEIQDFDNDGWPDLYTSVKIDTAEGPIPLIFRHTGLSGADPTFSWPEIKNPHYYAGGPVADYNRDGRLDVFFPEWRAALGQPSPPPMLMQNVSSSGNWLQVRVNDSANRMGIGAKIKVYKRGMSGKPAGLLGFQEMSVGFGFSSSGPAVVHFGLGDETFVDLTVEMPFGGPVYQKNAVPANRVVTVPNSEEEVPAHLGLEAIAVSDTSPQFLQPPAGASLPEHTVAATAPTVDFVAYPRPSYEGSPWSQWGAGLFASNGRFYAGMGDEVAPDGNSFLYEYDPITKKLKCIGDIQTPTDHVPGSWGHGKIHARITEAKDGFVYMTSYWGSRRGVVFDSNYQGSVLLRYPLFAATGSVANRSFFAQFGNGLGLSSILVLVNPSATTNASGTIRFFTSEGFPLAVKVNGVLRNGALSFAIPPKGVGFFETDGSGDLVRGSVQVSADVALTGTVLFAGSFGLAGVGSTEPLATFLAPFDFDLTLGIKTGVAISNPASSAVELKFTLRDNNGVPVPGGSVNVSLPPHGQLAQFGDELFAGKGISLSQFRGALHTEATLPVNATAIRASAGEFATLPVAAPERASQELHFSQFADGEGISSTLIVVNPSADTEARGTANLFRADGLPLVVDIDGSPRTGNFDFNIPPLGTGFFATDGLGTLVSGSARVTTNAPVGGSILFGGTIGVAGVGGVGPIKKFLAPIESDLSRRIQTGVALSNPGEMQVQVSVQLRDENGGAVPNGNLLLTLPPHGQLARFADEIFKEKGIDLSRFRGTLEVDSPAPIAGMAIRLNPGQFATFPVAPVQQ